MLLRTKSLSISGALRLWVLCKALDQRGSGKITRKALHGYLNSLQVPVRTQYRWLRTALDSGFITEAQNRGEQVFILAGLERVARINGLDEVGRRPVEVPAQKIVRPGWINTVWLAFLTTQSPQLSRETLEEMTGVERHRQVAYERGQPIEKRRNFVLGGTADHYLVEIDNSRFGTNTFIHTPSERVAHRLPDERLVRSNLVKQLPRGRCRKVNVRLRTNSCSMARVNRPQSIRLFYPDRPSAERAARKIATLDLPGIDQVYYPAATTSHGRIWETVTISHESHLDDMD
jgi:hypothetical protein